MKKNIQFLLVALCLGSLSCYGEIPRTADGKPDLNGIWQAMGSAHWNLEPHNAEAGPVAKMGAIGAIPGGLGVVEGGTIPYKPEALAIRDENRANWLEKDPVVKCYLPGVPRATYLPHPLQIFLAPDTTFITYEFAGADRIVYMNREDLEAQVDSWMGYNVGRWEGDTLVIDVTGQLPDTWFDHAGNWHSANMHVQERYTLVSENLIQYQATITDDEVFTKPWTIKMPLYRRLDDNMQLLDFKCVEFAEELLYGHLRKEASAE